MLGLPAIAVSAVRRARAGLPRRRQPTSSRRAFVARLVERARRRADARGHAAERELPGRRAQGASACRLGKRIYRDRLELTEEGDGRRRYRDLRRGARATSEEAGTDFAAIADGLIAVTPLHFDLTDQAGVEELAGFDLDAPAATGGARGR